MIRSLMASAAVALATAAWVDTFSLTSQAAAKEANVIRTAADLKGRHVAHMSECLGTVPAKPRVD